jgi:hypothetical protein
VKNVTLWGDRVEMEDEFDYDKCYALKAKEQGGKLTYITSPTLIGDNEVTQMQDLPRHGVEYASPSKLLDYADSATLFHGWVGKVIRDKVSGVIIGFELVDADGFPATVWGSEKFSPLPKDVKEYLQNIGDGDELLVYGYVSLSKTQSEPRINLKGLKRL